MIGSRGQSVTFCQRCWSQRCLSMLVEPDEEGSSDERDARDEDGGKYGNTTR